MSCVRGFLLHPSPRVRLSRTVQSICSLAHLRSSTAVTQRTGPSHNLTLLFGTMGVLSTGCKEPDGSGELQAVLEELRAVYEENSVLKLEIGHLKEELHECTEGQSCQSVAGAFFFFTTRSRISDRRALHPSAPLSSESGRGGRLSLERDSSEVSERFTRQFLGLRIETVALSQ